MSKHDTGGAASDFNAQELLRGYKFRNGVKVYCCYGMYCDAGHSGDCIGRGLEEQQARERRAALGWRVNV
jgi:hypothetical protein